MIFLRVFRHFIAITFMLLEFKSKENVVFRDIVISGGGEILAWKQ